MKTLIGRSTSVDLGEYAARSVLALVQQQNGMFALVADEARDGKKLDFLGNIRCFSACAMFCTQRLGYQQGGQSGVSRPRKSAHTLTRIFQPLHLPRLGCKHDHMAVSIGRCAFQARVAPAQRRSLVYPNSFFSSLFRPIHCPSQRQHWGVLLTCLIH